MERKNASLSADLRKSSRYVITLYSHWTFLLLSSSKITAFSSFDLCYFFFLFFFSPLPPFLFFIFINRLIFEDLTRDKRRSNQRHRHRQTREREKETVCMHVETRKRERETDRQAKRKIEKER